MDLIHVILFYEERNKNQQTSNHPQENNQTNY